MTGYEVLRKSLERVLLPIHRQVAVMLRTIVAKGKTSGRDKLTILDAGGRKSPYTIGLDAEVSILDLPRETSVQESLNLGLNEDIIKKTAGHRSNIKEIRIGDMTTCPYDDDSFDVIVSVEVLEHVDEDEKFVSEVRRVLKTDGVFVMTTPNGDWVPNTNPDHRRHYRREQLEQLLRLHFDEVDVFYAVIESSFRKWGVKSWSPRRPINTIKSIIGNLINNFESGKSSVRVEALKTHHLFAKCSSPRKVGEK
jgi:SAM-dependent methyltransferase